MKFSPGTLVRARGREWVVLPGGEDDLLLVRPLGGVEEETTGILTDLEQVTSAEFAPPDPKQAGDFRSCRLLRDAVRLGFRRSAGPFRSFAGIAVEPRPYQLVPLLMALKMDPIRLLIADDVGIGKTVEASLIAKELFDRGEIRRAAVLCPPHLAEQWQSELRSKFHIEATLVLASTAARLERDLVHGRSLFEEHPFVIVSLDYIKSDRRRLEFQRTCPEFVIVDEAHLCAYGADGRGGKHQRYELVKALAADPKRHMVFVSATPHSGNEETFRSLLAMLKPEFRDLPVDLSGRMNEASRKLLAEHVVQRRRGDISAYLDASTPFPVRLEAEETYALKPAYKKLFQDVVEYARGIVRDQSGDRRHQRVRWWAVLSMLRALASSPAAAMATLRSRAHTLNAETAEQADALGRQEVLDLSPEEGDPADIVHGADTAGEGQQPSRRLMELSKTAEALQGPTQDAKLARVVQIVGGLLKDGLNPILFCRFIDTADYVARHLRDAFPKVQVESVTGVLPHEDREAAVRQLGQADRRVLVCTDCLSEGINLQESFDAVVHYDLSWNPTRHEQREGRVDRFGQPQPNVKTLTLYGQDNQIDGIVLEVLLRKHQKIRKAMGISVPIPVDTGKVVEAIMEGLLLKGGDLTGQMILPGLEEHVFPQKQELEREWSSASEREKKTRSVFAQHSIKTDDVRREIDAMRATLGGTQDLKAFVTESFRLHGATVKETEGRLTILVKDAARSFREAADVEDEGDLLSLSFDPAAPLDRGAKLIVRTHPLVAGIAAYIADTTLDPSGASVARRCGVLLTKAVKKRTTLLLVRSRFHLISRRKGVETATLAEDVATLAFAGSPDEPEWLAPASAEALLAATPDANPLGEQIRTQIGRVVEALPIIRPTLERWADDRAKEIVEANRRVRQAVKESGINFDAKPQLPVDLLGIFVLLPKT